MNKLPLAVLISLICFTFTACKNPWVTELLKAPSELTSLEVVAYAGEHQLQGGASFEPGFNSAKRDYTVYVPMETSRFTINAAFDGNGTVTWKTDDMDINADPAALDFDLFNDEVSIDLVLTVQRENMEPGEYRLTVTRGENIPPPKVIAMHITPSVGTYFLESGVAPVVSVEVEEPIDGGTLAYQWFRNEDDNTATGSMLHGETGTSYTLSGFEIEEETTRYYYVEITKTLNGKMVTLSSMTCSVTFVDRLELLDVKSAKDETYWKTVPSGTVPTSVGTSNWASRGQYPFPWNTDGFMMGRYPVTYQLWDVVRRYAEMGPYRFASAGNQGARDSTNSNPQPVGTVLHPVTMISWRDAIVWCNAFSEMEGREPVYLDSTGKVLQDSRLRMEDLIDDSKTTGKNGYRLPTTAESEYAARGASPSSGSPWTDQWPGTNDSAQAALYVHDGGMSGTTAEVGSLNPNTIGLYDMTGMVQELTYASPAWLALNNYTIYTLGDSFKSNAAGNTISLTTNENTTITARNPGSATMTYGLRVIRSLDEGE